MKKSEPIIRIVLGILILLSGVNKFGYWINVSYMEDALNFVLKLSSIGGGFFIYAVGIIEIVLGLALIINKFKILSALALLPLMVSILAFHIFLDLKGILIALFVFILNVMLIFIYKNHVSGIFAVNSTD